MDEHPPSCGLGSIFVWLEQPGETQKLMKPSNLVDVPDYQETSVIGRQRRIQRLEGHFRPNPGDISEANGEPAGHAKAVFRRSRWNRGAGRGLRNLVSSHIFLRNA
jgi:hypothetical protein